MIGKLTEGLGKASDELSSLPQSIREQGFSALTNSLEEIKYADSWWFCCLNSYTTDGVRRPNSAFVRMNDNNNKPERDSH